MYVNINLIKQSSNPIRSSWDESKMSELVQSIQEQGILVPLMVRPLFDNVKVCRDHGLSWLEGTQEARYSQEPCFFCSELSGDYMTWWEDYLEEQVEAGQMTEAEAEAFEEPENGYVVNRPALELIDGHRRFEAAKRAGLEEVPVNVQEMSDTQAVIAALTTFVQREDVTAIDKAKPVKKLKEDTGWNIREIAAQLGVGYTTVQRWLALLDEPEEIQQLVATPEQLDNDDLQETVQKISDRHVDFVRAPLKDDSEARIAVLKKAAKENLSRDNARRIAESVAAAPSPEAKKHLIETPYSPYRHDPDFIKERAKKYGANDTIYRPPPTKTKSPEQEWREAPEVKNILARLKSWQEDVQSFAKADRLGKISPEGRQFIANKIRKLAEALNAWAQELERENGER